MSQFEASLPPGSTQGDAIFAPEASRRSGAVETRDGGLSSLIWRGLFLKIATLGIYRFWYKTNIRRWYWSRTRIGGDALEYTGTGRELLIGFLYALAILVPLYLIAATASLLVGEAAGSVVTGAVALIMVMLVQYGMFRSRRYRLTRTRWRGLRFDQTGSGWSYALKSLGWALVSFLTLFLAAPWGRAALERYKMENTRFGSAEGSLGITGGQLFPYWLIFWFACLLALCLAIAVPLYMLGGLGELGAMMDMLDGDSIDSVRFFRSGLGFAAALGFGLVLTLLAWPYYKAAEFRLMTSQTKIGGVSFSSTLATGTLYRIYLMFAACIAAYVIVVGGAVFLLISGNILASAFGPALLAILGYLGFFLLIGWAREFLLVRAFWLAAAETMSVENLSAAESVIARAQKDDNAAGEGLADAIDFGGV